jgi:hypothetical protein
MLEYIREARNLQRGSQPLEIPHYAPEIRRNSSMWILKRCVADPAISPLLSIYSLGPVVRTDPCMSPSIVPATSHNSESIRISESLPDESCLDELNLVAGENGLIRFRRAWPKTSTSLFNTLFPRTSCQFSSATFWQLLLCMMSDPALESSTEP